MTQHQDYVLVLDSSRNKSQGVHSLIRRLRYPAVIADSAEQAVAHAQQLSPCLVILMGGHESWSGGVIKQLRQTAGAASVTIVALTDAAHPRWAYQEDNPGLDGFLVAPLSRDVLKLLIESALAKQTRQFAP